MRALHTADRRYHDDSLRQPRSVLGFAIQLGAVRRGLTGDARPSAPVILRPAPPRSLLARRVAGPKNLLPVSLNPDAAARTEAAACTATDNARREPSAAASARSAARRRSTSSRRQIPRSRAGFVDAESAGRRSPRNDSVGHGGRSVGGGRDSRMPRKIIGWMMPFADSPVRTRGCLDHRTRPGRRVRAGGLCDFPAANSFAPRAAARYPAGAAASIIQRRRPPEHDPPRAADAD